MRHVLVSSLFALQLFACAPAPEDGGSLDEHADSGVVAAKLTATEKACMLGVVNDCSYGASFFDDTLAWDPRSAAAVVTTRAGLDAACGTADDAPFLTVKAVDAMPYVGDAALGRLLLYAAKSGCTATDLVAVVEGVTFSAAQAKATLAVANLASQDDLLTAAHLTAKTVAALIAARPFQTADVSKGLQELGAVPTMGTVTLTTLRDFSATFAPPTDACGELVLETSGVAFTATQAHNALDLVNHGETADLRAITGIGSALATRLMGARPFSEMAQVDAVKGIAVGVLTALRDQAPAKWCSKPAARCGCTSDDGTVALALDQAKSFLDDPTGPPAARFFALLGESSYQRLAVAVLGELAADFAAAPPTANDLESQVLAALSARLGQDRFARPFSVIAPTAPVPGDLATARQVAVDALILELGQSHFETTEIGKAFDDLIAGGRQAGYLADIQGWRDPQSAHVEVTESQGEWTFVGGTFGLMTEIHVSRATGQAESVFIEID